MFGCFVIFRPGVVEMCSCDFEIPKVSSVVFRKARKSHVCDECGCTIQSGDVYRIDSGFIEYWYKSKMCRRCQDLAWFIESIEDDFCFALGELQSQLLECEIVSWDEELDCPADLPLGLIAENGVVTVEAEISIARTIADERGKISRMDEYHRHELKYRQWLIDKALPDCVGHPAFTNNRRFSHE